MWYVVQKIGSLHFTSVRGMHIALVSVLPENSAHNVLINLPCMMMVNFPSPNPARPALPPETLVLRVLSPEREWIPTWHRAARSNRSSAKSMDVLYRSRQRVPDIKVPDQPCQKKTHLDPCKCLSSTASGSEPKRVESRIFAHARSRLQPTRGFKHVRR